MLRTLKRTWRGANEDYIGLVAAGISYYAFLAWVPMLAVIALLYGLVADPQTVARDIDIAGRALPPAAASLVADQLISVTQTNDGIKGIGLAVAFAFALFGARNAAGAIIAGLNVIFNVEETRSFLKSNGMAIAVTLGAVVGMALAGGAITMAAALPSEFAPFASYGLMFLFATFGAGFLYRVAPNHVAPGWSAVLPGAAVFALIWVGATALFGTYVTQINDYNATYGSLAAVVILMTWFYLSAYVLLLGGELVQAWNERH